MKLLKNLFFLMALATLVVSIAACEKEDECSEVTWYEDADEDGLGNPDVSQMACEQPAGFVSNSNDTNDALDSNCTFEDNARCYCTINPDDAARCTQSYGDSLFYGGFESFTEANLLNGDLEHTDREFENYGSLNGGADEDVKAVQGDNYLSFIVDPYTTELREGSTDPEGIFSVRENNTPRIDLTGFSDPYLNIWVNTGSSTTSVASIDFEMKYSSGDRERFFTYDFKGDENDQEAALIAVTTEGEWQLFSVQISQGMWHLDGSDPAVITNIWTFEGKTDADKTFERLAVHFRVNDENPNLSPENPETYKFAAHVDGLSISEGPLVDVRPLDP